MNIDHFSSTSVFYGTPKTENKYFWKHLKRPKDKKTGWQKDRKTKRPDDKKTEWQKTEWQKDQMTKGGLTEGQMTKTPNDKNTESPKGRANDKY